MNTPAVTGSKPFSLSTTDWYKLATGGVIGLVGIVAAQIIAWMSGGDFQTLFGDWAPLVAAVGMATVNTFVEVTKNGVDSKEAWKNAAWGALIAGLSAGFIYLQGLAATGEIVKNPYMLLVYAVAVNLIKRFSTSTEKPVINTTAVVKEYEP